MTLLYLAIVGAGARTGPQDNRATVDATGPSNATDHRRSGDRDRRSHDRSLHDAAGARRPRVRGRRRERHVRRRRSSARQCSRHHVHRPGRAHRSGRAVQHPVARRRDGRRLARPRHGAGRTDARRWPRRPIVDASAADADWRRRAAVAELPAAASRRRGAGRGAGCPARTHRHWPASRRARRRRRAAATDLREPSGIEPPDRARRGVVRPRGSGVRALRERRRRVGVREHLLSGRARLAEEPAHVCRRQPPPAERHDRSRSALRARSERPAVSAVRRRVAARGVCDVEQQGLRATGTRRLVRDVGRPHRRPALERPRRRPMVVVSAASDRRRVPPGRRERESRDDPRRPAGNRLRARSLCRRCRSAGSRSAIPSCWPAPRRSPSKCGTAACRSACFRATSCVAASTTRSSRRRARCTCSDTCPASIRCSISCRS